LPEISAIICTHNRSEYLKRAVESLLSQSISKERYEIIIIDNRSTDNTKEIVRDLFLEAPNIVYQYEERLGLSKARNRGLEESRSEIVVYMDDDAVACQDFLKRHLEAYEKVSPTPVSVGGRIYLDWEMPKPGWYPDTEGFERCLTRLDYGDEARFLEFTRCEYPYGANMSFLKSDLLEIGGFEIGLGRQGTNLLSNEESRMFYALYERKAKVYYEPRAYVRHAVLKERINKKFFYRRFYWQGISNAIWCPPVWTSQPSSIIGHIRGLARGIVELIRLYCKRGEKERESLMRICQICFHGGFIKQRIF